ncbi:hypothetical protein [Prosthecobacter dejongeii]|uniref:Uncharacterized protein n=1 Tax=Prosthecobacter dejongeii TaxID=48465 RepID=A0A7W7YQY6_9BACT|nr:hypothetical protein [Prosthecobacter dejongeii]MBB5040597.1 hypothetical protein [Prosthecobacter dejongeii]
MRHILLLLLFLILSPISHGSDTDEIHEDSLLKFDSDWKMVKVLFLGESPSSWMELKELAPDHAHRISRFWIRKADIGTIQYRKLILEMMAEEIKRTKPENKDKMMVRYQGCMPEAVRCYYYDHASEIDKMIQVSLEMVNAAASEPEIKTISEHENPDLHVFEKNPESSPADLPKPSNDTLKKDEPKMENQPKSEEVEKRLEELRRKRDEYFRNLKESSNPEP